MATKKTAVNTDIDKLKTKAAKTEREPDVAIVEKDESKARTFRPDDLVTVKNGFAGRLVYKSRRNGERFIWEETGDEQDMEFQTLKDARNSSKEFFINNWFIIEDQDVINALNLKKYYEGSIRMDDLYQLIEKKPEVIMKTVAEMPNGQKETLKLRVRQMIADEEIDSIKVISAFEKSLGVKLTAD